MPSGRVSVRMADLDILGNAAHAAQGVKHVLAGRGFKEQAEREYFRNLDFVEGGYRQWQRWKEGKRQLDERMAQYDYKAACFNFIIEIVETLVARALRVAALPVCKGVTTDANDMRAARRQSDVARYYHEDKLQMEVVLTKLFTAYVCGSVVWIEGGYDPNVGEIVETTMDDFIAGRLDEQPGAEDDEALRGRIHAAAEAEFESLFGKKAKGRRGVAQPEGDLIARVRTLPYISWWPWKIPDFSLVQWYVISEDVPVEIVAERYDMTLDEVRSHKTGERRNKRPFGPAMDGNRAVPTGDDGDPQQEAETIAVHEFMTRPTRDMPKGAMGVLLGDAAEAIRVQRLDTHKGRLRLFHFQQIPLPDRLLGPCTVGQLVPLQKDANKWASLRTLKAEFEVFGRWYVPTDGITPNDPDWKVPRTPGECRKVQGGNQNIPVNVKGSDALFPADEIISADIDMARQISGVTYVSAGKPGKSGVTSGRGIEKLEERISERSDPTTKRNRAMLARFWQFQVEELINKTTGDRIAQITGDKSPVETFIWNKEDITPTTVGQPGRDLALVSFEFDESEPMSRTERRNMAITLIREKALRPGEHDAEIFKAFGLGELRPVIDSDRPHRRRQQYEIELWRQGQFAPKPFLQQEHQVHLDEIALWMCETDEYFEIIEDFPYLEDEIQGHIRLHEVYKARQQVRPLLIDERARVEEWAAQFREIETDVKAGRATPELLKLITPQVGMDGRPTPPILMPLQGILQLRAPAMAPPGPTPEAAEGGESEPKVGTGEERSQHKDLSDQGYDRENLSNTGAGSQ